MRQLTFNRKTNEDELTHVTFNIHSKLPAIGTNFNLLRKRLLRKKISFEGCVIQAPHLAAKVGSSNFHGRLAHQVIDSLD